jgi:hypothetical protein
MEQLTIHNKHFITYNDNYLLIDVLGGVDLVQMDRLVCTLRITYKDYPPYRTTIDLYSDHQLDIFLRTLCDKWELKLFDASKTLHKFILEVEKYRLDNLQYKNRDRQEFVLKEEERKQAFKLLKSKNLLKQVSELLVQTGIIGENENAQILFMAMASHRYNNPFSVICMAKSGMGKSYILHKLLQCAPNGYYSFHTQISKNAIYYFNQNDINHKILFVEDLEWTPQMLAPLSTLQTHGRIAKTRAAKDRDGNLRSTTFEVSGKLCLLACANSEKYYENFSMPFLLLNLNHSQSQDTAIMEYQKKCKAGLIEECQIKHSQHILKTLIASLNNVCVKNPYAQLIDLPQDIVFPRKSLLLFLNFIETITFLHQHQREYEKHNEKDEIVVKTHPHDIELAFKLLKNNLFRRADELSTSTRFFFNRLQTFLSEANAKQFTALDIRKSLSVHPRTLNRYLQELKQFSYLQITGGNKHREGFTYKLTNFDSECDTQSKTEQSISNVLKNIWNEYRKQNETKKSEIENRKL